MRGRIGVFINPSGIGRTSKLVSCASFSSSSDGSGGQGRGRGVSVFNFVAGIGNDDSNGRGHGHGHGHGRGNPLPSSPFLPSFVAPDPNPPPEQPGIGRGRGRGAPGNKTKRPIYLKKDNDTMGTSSEANPPPEQPGIGRGRGRGAPGNETKRPIYLKKDNDTMGTSSEAHFVESVPRQPIGERNLPENLLTVLAGTGRGRPERKPFSQDKVKEENRHLRPRRVGASATATGAGRGADRVAKGDVARPKLSREEAVKKAVGVLSRNDEGSGTHRGVGGGRRRRVAGGKDDEDDDDDDGNSEEEDRLFGIGDDADGEKLANKLGPSMMAELSEALDDMLEERMPAPGDEDYLEAYDTNLKIELEPEYLMGNFETNPDINENPPIPLREALEKMKPFLMAYEGIVDQEEWEEIIQNTMESVPLMKEVVDHYCGPDRVTAKQQHEELERVANTLPVSAPNSVKCFTNRAVLSLQSNPGWGFHRKCQFMDKLVDEVSKSYK